MPAKKEATKNNEKKINFKKSEGENANVIFEVDLQEELIKKAENLAIKNIKKYVNIPGFRKGSAPDEIVKKKIGKEILLDTLKEELVFGVIREIGEEEKRENYISMPYNIELKDVDYDENLNLKIGKNPKIKFELDSNVKIDLKKGREKNKLPKLNTKVEKEEVDKAVLMIKERFAEYKLADKITKDTIAIIKVSFYDKDDKVLEVKKLYLGNQELEKDKFFEQFLGKEKNELIKLDFDPKKFPKDIQPKEEFIKDTKYVTFMIQTIEEKIEPKLDKDFFEKNKITDESGKAFENESEFKKFVKKVLKEEKTTKEIDQNLIKYIDKLIEDGIITIKIPKTLLDKKYEDEIKYLQQEKKLNFNLIKPEEQEEIKKQIKKKVENDIKYGTVIGSLIKEIGADKELDNLSTPDFLKKLWEKLDEFTNKK